MKVGEAREADDVVVSKLSFAPYASKRCHLVQVSDRNRGTGGQIELVTDEFLDIWGQVYNRWHRLKGVQNVADAHPDCFVIEPNRAVTDKRIFQRTISAVPKHGQNPLFCLFTEIEGPFDAFWPFALLRLNLIESVAFFAFSVLVQCCFNSSRISSHSL